MIKIIIYAKKTTIPFIYSILLFPPLLIFLLVIVISANSFTSNKASTVRFFWLFMYFFLIKIKMLDFTM